PLPARRELDARAAGVAGRLRRLPPRAQARVRPEPRPIPGPVRGLGAPNGSSLELDHADLESPVGPPRIAAAVRAFQHLVESLDPVARAKISGGSDVIDDLVALEVDVRCDVVRDLAGRVAQADALVECRRAEPERLAVRVELVGTPEADVMPARRIASDRLL